MKGEESDQSALASLKKEKKMQQAQIKFYSKQPNITAIPEAPIRVPADLHRFGLSEIINHLLGNDLTIERKIPYDFLIDGHLLRSSVQDFMVSSKISMEETLHVEVIQSLPPPKEVCSIPNENWISSLDDYTNNGLSSSVFVLSGGYDGTARIWDQTGVLVSSIGVGQGKAVKSVKWIDGNSFLAGSLDSSVSLFKFASENQRISAGLIFRGHEGSIECFDVSSDKQHFISGSFDETIKLWDFDEISATSAAPQVSSKKRQKQEENRIKTAKVTFGGHRSAVTGVLFDKLDNNIFYSTGMDHSLRQWDIESATNTTTFTAPHAALCLEHGPSPSAVLTGHSDRLIRMWDSRANDGTMVKQVFSGHSSWISNINWSPESVSHQFISSSFDGTCKFWDIRSNTAPIYTIKGDGTKVLDVCWAPGMVASAGEDKKIHMFSTEVLNEETTGR